jgi:hypothetical protein
VQEQLEAATGAAVREAPMSRQVAMNVFIIGYNFKN